MRLLSKVLLVLLCCGALICLSGCKKETPPAKPTTVEAPAPPAAPDAPDAPAAATQPATDEEEGPPAPEPAPAPVTTQPAAPKG